MVHCLGTQCFQNSSKILLRFFLIVLPRCLPALLRLYLATWFPHFSHYFQVPQNSVLWLANCLGLGEVCPEWTRGLARTTAPSSCWWHLVTWRYVQICFQGFWGTDDFQVCWRQDTKKVLQWQWDACVRVIVWLVVYGCWWQGGVSCFCVKDLWVFQRVNDILVSCNTICGIQMHSA